jgi:predicted enzyme related to lactoylglutathione lyase
MWSKRGSSTAASSAGSSSGSATCRSLSGGLGGELFAVVAGTDGTEVPPHWSVNFAVGDVDATAEHTTGLGGAALMPPFDTPGLRDALIADPQGGVIALSGPHRLIRCTALDWRSELRRESARVAVGQQALLSPRSGRDGSFR